MRRKAGRLPQAARGRAKEVTSQTDYQTALAVVLALLAFPAIVSARKVRKDKPPTQEAVVHGCASVKDIRAAPIWGSVDSLTATVDNSCAQTIHAFVTVAFYFRDGTQATTSTEYTTLAPGTQWRFRSLPDVRSEVHSAKVIEFQVD